MYYCIVKINKKYMYYCIYRYPGIMPEDKCSKGVTQV